ncbi:MAG: AraC family transcriptional regulator [Phycisphaeraceae bacterium]
MRPVQEKLRRHAERSFLVARRRSRSFGFQWHQHPECELTLIESGRGQRFVGDSIEMYRPGDLVLLGPNLPHTWASYPGTAKMHSAVVIQFDADWLLDMLASTPESRVVCHLIERSGRGLGFSGPSAGHVRSTMTAMIKQSGFKRVLTLLEMLDMLSRSRAVRTLASPAFKLPTSETDARVDRVCRFIHDHVTEPITQSDAAGMIGMSGPAFSRFFKRHIGMTFSRYVHELRIGHACRLLLETDKPVTDICFASGFNNLSNFNRVFLALKGLSPRAYRREHAWTQATGG